MAYFKTKAVARSSGVKRSAGLPGGVQGIRRCWRTGALMWVGVRHRLFFAAIAVPSLLRRGAVIRHFRYRQSDR